VTDLLPDKACGCPLLPDTSSTLCPLVTFAYCWKSVLPFLEQIGRANEGTLEKSVLGAEAIDMAKGYYPYCAVLQASCDKLRLV
jgi:hypothetical protein